MKSEIQKHLNKAARLAEIEVERMARNILSRHKHLDYFIMAMGTYYFVDKKGNNISTTEEVYRNYRYSWDYSRAYFKPLTDFISKFDDTLKITGSPMKFTATGKKITNW